MAVSKFRNEPILMFTNKSDRKKMEQEIVRQEKQFGREYPCIIGGEEVYTPEKFNTVNPSNTDEIIGVFQKATEAEALRALDAATEAFNEWQYVPAKKRAEYLFKAAKVMRKRRFELNAVEVLEAGKPWVEADADVAEAIDFLEFYGREMLRLSEKQPITKLPNEKNELVYIPLGVGVVIPPWNFPLAILAGMTSAALVAGNTVVLKPSSDTPLVGYKFMEILREVKLPAGVVNFVSGPGSRVGDTLVQSPKTRFISFTGSMEVGNHIYASAAQVKPGQIWLKRVVAEMGGKDSIIVDKQADLKAAADGVVSSAFGFQGQKCSACSRVIVDESVYDSFLEMIVERTARLTVGPAKDFGNAMGPVINKSSQDSILAYIQKGIDEGGRLVYGGNKTEGNGFFIQPTVIAGVDPKATIAQEEIFGPVLAVIKARDYEDALQIANNTIYGLTGAVYTRNRKKIEEAKKRFHIGNLYFNRKCTGAMVGAHPFGGFNMSGTDSKAGGRDYLLLFTQAKVWSEKVK
jgi:1-pyrroline-5-carboxylate dehydrogenase